MLHGPSLIIDNMITFHDQPIRHLCVILITTCCERTSSRGVRHAANVRIMPELTNGVIYFGGVGVTLALTVRQGQIIKCHPPREWPLKRSAVDLWTDATTYGAALRWEEHPCPTQPEASAS